MVVEVRETVDVRTAFGERRKVTPRKFIWKHLPYEVNKVLSNWSARKGENVSEHYSVTDGMNVYHLSHNQKTSEWQLVTIDDRQNFQRAGCIAC